MTIINVKDIKPGMILSEDVVYANGRVLLNAGSELKESHIKIFKTWGILSLKISKDQDKDQDKNHTPDEINRVTSEKQILFQNCDLEHPFINALFHASIDMALEQKNEKS